METKCCSTCKNEYPNTLEYFYKRHGKGREGQLLSYCKPCFIQIQKDKHKRLKLQYLAYKGGASCVVCKYGDEAHSHNLAFHHTNSETKERQIGASHIALEKLKKELDKCIVVCHLCHNDIHQGILRAPGIEPGSSD